MKTKPRPTPKSKRKRKGLKKEYNIDAMVSNMRRYGLPGCRCCAERFANVLENPKRYRKRLFRRESAYISR